MMPAGLRCLDTSLTSSNPMSRYGKRSSHADDLERVQREIDAHLAGAGRYYETEYRVRARTGGWRWILDRGMVIERDQNGQALRVIGTHLDITQRKKFRESLVQSKAPAGGAA